MKSLPTFTPRTRRVTIICASIVIVTLIVSCAVTGDLGILLEFFKSVVE